MQDTDTDIKQELCESQLRWLSWASVPNKPTVSVNVKQHFDQPDIKPAQCDCSDHMIREFLAAGSLSSPVGAVRRSDHDRI